MNVTPTLTVHLVNEFTEDDKPQPEYSEILTYKLRYPYLSVAVTSSNDITKLTFFAPGTLRVIPYAMRKK